MKRSRLNIKTGPFARMKMFRRWSRENATAMETLTNNESREKRVDID